MTSNDVHFSHHVKVSPEIKPSKGNMRKKKNLLQKPEPTEDDNIVIETDATTSDCESQLTFKYPI